MLKLAYDRHVQQINTLLSVVGYKNKQNNCLFNTFNASEMKDVVFHGLFLHV